MVHNMDHVGKIAQCNKAFNGYQRSVPAQHREWGRSGGDVQETSGGAGILRNFVTSLPDGNRVPYRAHDNM